MGINKFSMMGFGEISSIASILIIFFIYTPLTPSALFLILLGITMLNSYNRYMIDSREVASTTESITSLESLARENRAQAMLAVKEVYKQRGFSGKLLEDIYQAISADDYKIIDTMAQSELPKRDSIEHPLKSSLSLFYGEFIALSILLATSFFMPPLFIYLLSLAMSGISTILLSRFKKIDPLAPVLDSTLSWSSLVYLSVS